MQVEEIIKLWIYFHAATGGIALLAGMIAIITKKGGVIHKNSGSVFYYSMLLSATVALVISLVPQHENPFLFSIGIFSLYMLILGKRSLRFKRKVKSFLIEKVIAYIMLFTGLGMILLPVLMQSKINIVLLIFGALGFGFAIRDLLLFRNPKKVKKSWLVMHIGNMMGGYIACVSAFMVVNQVLPGALNWFAPSIPGTIFIVYWIKKVKPKKVKVAAS